MDSDLNNLAIVAAVAESNVIGRDGSIPWRLPSDMQRFRMITTGHNVVMGRKTWESIVKRLGGPLPDRINVVVTRQTDYHANGARLCGSLRDALALCRLNGRFTFIIGGAEIYQQTLPLAQRIHLTLVHTSITGDTFFPHFDRWTMTHFRRFSKNDRNEHDYTFAVYERKPQESFVYLSNAREPQQWSLMEKILVAGVCPFCPGRLEQYHAEPIIRENQCWILTQNQTPYLNTRIHLLLIHRRHTESLSQLDAVDWQMLGSMISWAEDKFQVTGGGLALRFGDPRVNGGTVKHLHAHLLSAEVTDQNRSDYHPVRVRVG